VGSDWALGAVELKVLGLDRQAAFYDTFGLDQIARDEQHADFGADGSTLLRLTALPGGRERPSHTAGLFHFAILVPSEEELGGFLQRTLEERLPLTGTADHFVSQALYFDDPEGNGIEGYADGPRSEGQYPDGRVNIGTDHLDFERLLRVASPAQPKFSAGPRPGPMHPNCAGPDLSHAFYESLGMELMAQAGHVMRFMSWDGYHHHLGINLLQGHGAAPVEPEVRGLRGFEIRRLEAALTDPNGILLTRAL